LPHLELIQLLLLAVVQGIAEFLPVSSSGHVVVMAALFDEYGQPLEEKLTVNIVLHFGTLLAIVVYYWQRIWRLITKDFSAIPRVLVGSIPAACVGLSIKFLELDAWLENPLVAGFCFVATGWILLWARSHEEGELRIGDLGYVPALVIGAFQALAILPGISRSGATIAAGLGSRLTREESAAFSFLLAIPAIAGATLIECVKLMKEPPPSVSYGSLLIGTCVAFGIGWISLAWLLRWLKSGRLHEFAWYLFILGPLVVAWQLWLMLR